MQLSNSLTKYMSFMPTNLTLLWFLFSTIVPGSEQRLHLRGGFMPVCLEEIPND